MARDKRSNSKEEKKKKDGSETVTEPSADSEDDRSEDGANQRSYGYGIQNTSAMNNSAMINNPATGNSSGLGSANEPNSRVIINLAGSDQDDQEGQPSMKGKAKKGKKPPSGEKIKKKPKRESSSLGSDAPPKETGPRGLGGRFTNKPLDDDPATAHKQLN
jgi:hypothetical protein